MADMIEPVESNSIGEYCYEFEIPEGKKIRDLDDMSSQFDAFCTHAGSAYLEGLKGNKLIIEMRGEGLTEEEAKTAAIEGFNEQLVEID